ncbi:uncharacterized protein RCC_08827 [Ramularia collo-cygni]|uniref:Uncharacterized protein n=1 Tax=Ramularia collo-cygni TaxID=112498 RepID=A0A2D3UYG3_9PEZI|nr:uncharacterized protein RCC_08827 [Ramularia collo-cygni]CZT23117.1 uncharacterized protein RCC_08827 [Ramularia collo-cygni]
MATDPTDVGPAPGSSATNPGRLRMCHYRHLTFTKFYPIWGNPSRVSANLVDKYFVPENLYAYRSGGPVYEVQFPDNAVMEVLTCRMEKCFSCKAKGLAAVKEGPTSNVHLIHRVDTKMDPGKTIPRYIAKPKTRYEHPDWQAMTELKTVMFELGGPDGESSVYVACRVCVEGHCEACDDRDRRKREGLLLEDELDVEELDEKYEKDKIEKEERQKRREKRRIRREHLKKKAEQEALEAEKLKKDGPDEEPSWDEDTN